MTAAPAVLTSAEIAQAEVLADDVLRWADGDQAKISAVVSSLDHGTPLSRLYALAIRAGIEVADQDLSWFADGGVDPEGVAALVAHGERVVLNQDLGEDDGLRADVLAMALSVANCMVGGESAARPGVDIVAPSGFVAVSREREAEPAETVGQFATEIARRCGRDVGSAAFGWWVIVCKDDPEQAGGES